MVVDKGRLPEKILKSKIKAPPINAGHNIAFYLLSIWLQTLVAINSESCQTSFPNFCSLSSEVAVLFDSKLSRCPFLGQIVDLDLLLCTLHSIQFRTCEIDPMPYSYSETNEG